MRWNGICNGKLLSAFVFGLMVSVFPPLLMPPMPPKINAGDTAWMLTSTALVLLMTIPGLAVFYGGMVRRHNVLSTVMQSFATACLVTVLWMIVATASRSATAMPISAISAAFFLKGMDMNNAFTLGAERRAPRR